MEALLIIYLGNREAQPHTYRYRTPQPAFYLPSHVRLAYVSRVYHNQNAVYSQQFRLSKLDTLNSPTNPNISYLGGHVVRLASLRSLIVATCTTRPAGWIVTALWHCAHGSMVPSIVSLGTTSVVYRKRAFRSRQRILLILSRQLRIGATPVPLSLIMPTGHAFLVLMLSIPQVDQPWAYLYGAAHNIQPTQ
jgi:hypothetical protein